MIKLYMDYLRCQLGKFVKDEEGAALLEYTVLLVIILGGAIAMIILAGGWVSSQWNDLFTAINTYNRRNPEGVSYNFDYTERTYASGLPILPILGVKGTW